MTFTQHTGHKAHCSLYHQLATTLYLTLIISGYFLYIFYIFFIYFLYIFYIFFIYFFIYFLYIFLIFLYIFYIFLYFLNNELNFHNAQQLIELVYFIVLCLNSDLSACHTSKDCQLSCISSFFFFHIFPFFYLGMTTYLVSVLLI